MFARRRFRSTGLMGVKTLRDLNLRAKRSLITADTKDTHRNRSLWLIKIDCIGLFKFELCIDGKYTAVEIKSIHRTAPPLCEPNVRAAVVAQSLLTKNVIFECGSSSTPCISLMGFLSLRSRE